MRAAFVCLLAALSTASCTELPAACERGEAISGARALDATRVELTFACRIDVPSASAPESYAIADYTAAPTGELPVVGAEVRDHRVVLATAPQSGGVTYTVNVDGVRDAAGNTLSDSANFVGSGDRRTAPITFVVDDGYHQRLTAVALLISADPATGAFDHRSHRVPLADEDGDHRFEATLELAVDPARTVDSADDRLGPAFVAYNALAVDGEERSLSELVLFAVPDESPHTVEIPLLSVPDPPLPEGLAAVRFRVDDRPAGALRAPTLRGSFDDQGRFDAEYPATIALQDDDGDGVWEGTARVRIAPGRRLDGNTDETRPYSAYLVEDGTPYSARSADFLVPDEQPVEVPILIGHPDRVAVTFRVDVAAAWLDPDGTSRGLYPGEAVFLTGEFGQAEDAFGQNASDAFSGGENVVLQMTPLEQQPGVWQRTIFLPKNRPYGWKVVRCPRDKGCSALNKMVSSSGRAFPTVMKNLVTELCDVAKQSWVDVGCSTPRLIDPRNLGAVDTGQGVLDYSQAQVFVGGAQGPVEQDPPGTPDGKLMFKQEVPDLVVEVADQPVATPVYVVGSWRDVNIPGTPSDIIAGGQILDLGKTDYDAGMIGLLPPSYELAAPPKPSPFTMDGQLDSQAKLIAGGGATMSLHAALANDYLYLATEDAGEGSDHFLLLSTAAPGALRPAPWGKGGQVAFGGRALFLADENDGPFCGWFELGTPDLLLLSGGSGPAGGLDAATPASNGGVLEGVIHLPSVFGSVPAALYLAVGPWDTADGGALYSSGQTPASGDGDGDVQASEILQLSLPLLEVQP